MSDMNEAFHSVNWIESPVNTDGSNIESPFTLYDLGLLERDRTHVCVEAMLPLEH